MRFHRTGFAFVLLAVSLSGIGCQSFWNSFDDNGPKRWTAEWYAQQARSPEGTRQLKTHGRMWPPYARPRGRGQQWSHRFHGAHYWPHPYNCQDRAYLRNVSATQVSQGWVQETTLFGYHFHEKDNTLNRAGRLRVKYILQTIPEQRRQIWVQAADDQAISEARLTDVHNYAASLIGDSALPEIALRVTPADGRPTDEINRLRTLETGSMPTPRIPYSSSSTAGGGAASGTGAAQ